MTDAEITAAEAIYENYVADGYRPTLGMAEIQLKAAMTLADAWLAGRQAESMRERCAKLIEGAGEPPGTDPIRRSVALYQYQIASCIRDLPLFDGTTNATD